MILVSLDSIVSNEERKIRKKALFNGGYSPGVNTRLSTIVSDSQSQMCNWNSGGHLLVVVVYRCFSFLGRSIFFSLWLWSLLLKIRFHPFFPLTQLK
uniref:Uncharacterized protein n=1 Tax=Manihot esculenta TaxID=3983 RepID=A0A2C9VBC2_MANES